MTNKYIYFIANWKMFGNLRTLNSLNSVISFVKKFKKNKLKIIYCPPATLLNPLSEKLKSSSIQIGAQNCHESDNYGAFTGHINSNMIKSVGAKYVILGHSENRQMGENDNVINKKIKSSIKSGLKVIFCIGETLNEKRRKATKRVLERQISLGLKNVNKKNSNIIIAYEPIWSIGTGLVPTVQEIIEVKEFVYEFLAKSKNICKVAFLYGGSVNSKNAKEILIGAEVDGSLIGGSSLKITEMNKILTLG